MARQLEEEFLYLILDTLYEKIREEGVIRRYVIRIFPNSESCLCLIRALAVETHEYWLETHRYLK